MLETKTRARASSTFSPEKPHFAWVNGRPQMAAKTEVSLLRPGTLQTAEEEASPLPVREQPTSSQRSVRFALPPTPQRRPSTRSFLKVS